MRYIVIWSPRFERGQSRMGSVNLLRAAWVAKQAPELAKRRRIFLADVSDSRVHDLCAAFMRDEAKKEMKPQKRLSVILISDPAWDSDPERWLTAASAMRAGQRAEAKGRPPIYCILTIESEEPLEGPSREV